MGRGSGPDEGHLQCTSGVGQPQQLCEKFTASAVKQSVPWGPFCPLYLSEMIKRLGLAAAAAAACFPTSIQLKLHRVSSAVAVSVEPLEAADQDQLKKRSGWWQKHLSFGCSLFT